MDESDEFQRSAQALALVKWSTTSDIRFLGTSFSVSTCSEETFLFPAAILLPRTSMRSLCIESDPPEASTFSAVKQWYYSHITVPMKILCFTLRKKEGSPCQNILLWWNWSHRSEICQCCFHFPWASSPYLPFKATASSIRTCTWQEWWSRRRSLPWQEID